MSSNVVRRSCGGVETGGVVDVDENEKIADCGRLFFGGWETAGLGDFGITSLKVVNFADCGGGEDAPLS